MHLSKRALGIGFGVVYGLVILVGTWFILLFGAQGSFFARLSIFFRGYSVSWGGSIIGLIWGFIFGFIIGFLIAAVYNLADDLIKKPKVK